MIKFFKRVCDLVVALAYIVVAYFTIGIATTIAYAAIYLVKFIFVMGGSYV